MTHKTTLRVSFYTLLMFALYSLDTGAGISRALRDVQGTHNIHTGKI